MSAPVKLNLKIYQGSTFKEVLRWESATKAYKSIAAISKSAPCTVTSTAHGLPVGWRTKLTSILGTTELNSTENYQIISSVAANTITFNDINSLSYKDYISGGVIEYNIPNVLSGITARMQIRTKIADVTVLDELTTANGKIIVDDSAKTITILLSAVTTAAYTFSSAIYSMELINGSEVLPFIYGTITLDKEITR